MRTGTGKERNRKEKENKGYVHVKRIRTDIHEKEPVYGEAKQERQKENKIKEKKNPGKWGKKSPQRHPK